MSHWEEMGKSNDWWTPKYIFDALGCHFDMDVAAPLDGPLYVPCDKWLHDKSLGKPWHGFIWMNPPFGRRNGLVPWMNKFRWHGNGIALVPDRTSAPWWQDIATWADEILFINGKVRFIRPDGSIGKSPSVGTTLVGMGPIASSALASAECRGLGKRFWRAAA